jgi:hypothetical protein
MSYLHVVATLAGGNRKVVENKIESEVISSFIVPFLREGTITTPWGRTPQTRQALELRIYQADTPYSRKTSGDFESFIKGRRNRYNTLAGKAEKLLGQAKARVFIVTPIQGDEFGVQEQQRIYREFDERFEALETVLSQLGCVAIRIDKEQPLDDVVDRIKTEIERSSFVIADLTDERPSCYYELGYADGLGIPVICVASQDSVLHPGTPTRIHFDIHRHVLMFTNHRQLQTKVKTAFEKNRDLLLTDRRQSRTLEVSD